MTQEPSEGAGNSQARDKFEELRLCVAIWERRLSGADHPWQRLCRDSAFAFRQICQDGLLGEAARAVAAGRPEQATARLDVLAGIDPDHCVFDLATAASGKMAPHLAACHDFLLALSRDPTWATGAGADDLRALLGLNRFLCGFQPEGLALLSGVRWDRIKLPRYFLQKITLLYWSGAAEIVAAYLKALAPFFLDPACFDRGSRILGGVFGALSGEADFAGAVLEPLLPLVLNRPELLFQVMDGLLFAGRAVVLRAFFCAPGRLADLEGRLDREQRLRLLSLLFAAGCLREAGQGFADLAGSHDPGQLAELPQIVYGLVLSGREALAERLALAVPAGGTAAGTQDVLPAAEALIQVGRADRAEELLAGLSREALADQGQASAFFNLHERLSRIEGMDRAWPMLRQLAAEGSMATLDQIFWMFFYAGKLEEGLALVTEPGFGRRFGTGFPIRAAFLLWLGRFDEAAACLGERGYAGNGPVAWHRILFSTMLHLANRDTAAALASYRAALALLDVLGPNLGRRWLPLAPVFEYLLLLRQLGRLDEAADTAARYVRRYDLAGNPCRPLLALLTRELDRPVCSPEAEAGQCEQAADRLGDPRSYCQGWLYLQAAVLRAGLGQFAAADRILQTKLAAVLFLDPATRSTLRTAASTELAVWRKPLQAMFFPHFTATYWNRLLDAVLAPVGGRTVEGDD